MKKHFKTLILSIISSVTTSIILGSIFFINKQETSCKTFPQNLMYISTSNASSSLTIPQIVKKAAPSVVAIKTSITVPNRLNQALSQTSSEGSGIIFDANGYIMTNYHVVEYADPKNPYSKYTTLEVFLPDGRQSKAQFIGGDKKTDLAVIKISLDNLPVAELGNSDSLEVGELAVAIGNPLGINFAGTVTSGIISAVNRKVQIGDKVLNLIQTDAAINPGNSGGALVNSKGQVIGINTAKISNLGLEGLGFAIPINDAKPIIDQLVMFGYVKGRPFIGISGREITQAISNIYKIPQGIYVISVTKGSGAEKAGIKVGDIILKLDNKRVISLLELENIKSKYKAGDTVEVVLYRDGKQITTKLTFSEEK
ncbi:serine protease Do [Caloramator fervidus]|uniref:Serine protease Do n=1 Tax=Caloramator fervidus TaxID=29344 RepID=A0A1H5UU99_9CLOT|nr:trypsin-like peptidase domain-containing protein [Caloramator fervidus]SEF78645.1 serine protease Do [Caloramator fervidus]